MTFASAAKLVERASGSPWAFGTAIASVLIWAGLGPLFGWSDTWQLVINTATTIVTFLMMFLIQSAQRRGTEALHIKLDELIRVTRRARNEMINAEDMDDTQLSKIQEDLRKSARLP